MHNNPIKFEQGPIRPPNEARSLLLRLTRNCPWNRCLFCPVYKGRKFSLRSVAEIKKDIQTARDMADEIKLRSLRVPRRVPLYRNLQDGSFSMQTDDMLAEEIKLLIENLD